MELENLLIRFVIFSLEMVIAGVMLIKHRLTFRFKPYIAIPIGLIIAFAGAAIDIVSLYFFVKPEQWNEFIKIAVYAIAVATVFAGFLFAYNIKVPQLLLLLSVAYTFQHMAYQWGVIVLDTGLGGVLNTALPTPYYNLVYNLILYAVKIGIYVAAYFLIARFYIKYSKYILGTANIIVLGALVFLIANVVNVYVSERLQSDYTMRGILAAALIIFCLTLVVGGFRVMEHRQETTIIKATLNSKVRQQEMMENNINFINMKCHDLRKELRGLKEKKGNLSDDDFLLLEESLNFYDSSVQTGNVNIDALIQEKLIYCNSVGIEFTALVDGDAFKDMASSDIYFLLVNIIDNAIEAAEAFDEKGKRVISLTASKRHGVLLIEETNYYKGKLSMNSDGSIKTTKENKKYHGYGTKSIAYIVKKYDGKMEYEIKDDIFKLKIAI